MRIISGTLKGLRFSPPKNLPVRPTTDLAKESLFNILINRFTFDELKVLDLFCGTGNISFEFASRGCKDITAVDKHTACLNFIRQTAEKLKIEGLKTYRSDVSQFLELANEPFDIIFADPPYDMKNISSVAEVIFEKGLLKKNGWLIIEHASLVRLGEHPNFKEIRRYGQSSFSIFEQ